MKVVNVIFYSSINGWIETTQLRAVNENYVDGMKFPDLESEILKLTKEVT